MPGRPGITQKRFSRDRFQQLPPDGNMASSRDATIDIPLTAVTSKPQTGARKAVNVDTVAGETNDPFAGRRQKTDTDDGQQLHSREDGNLNKMGRFYLKILNFSVVTRYFIYVSPLAFLIAIPIIAGATAAKDAAIGGVRIVWFFTWVEVLWLSLWVSKSIAHYIPSLFQALCGVVSSGTRKYALILTALEIPISLVGWSATSLATFIPLMTKNPDKQATGDTGTKPWQDVLKNILFAAFVSTLILAAEKILIQLIAIGHHREQFDMKIQESKQNIRLLALLYETSRKIFPEYCKEFATEDYMISNSIVGSGGHIGHKRPGSASPMRLIQNVGRVGDKISAAVGNVAQEITGKQVFNSGSAHSVVTTALEKQKSSEALARRLWMSFVLHGRDALYLEDLKDVLGREQEKDAEECFAILDRDENGDISLDEMVATVTEFGTERHSISKSMHDTGQAIRVLDNLLCTLVFGAAVLVFVAFLNQGFGTTLAAGATALLSLSFIFSRSAQEVLGSCIFLFVEHPYDVGDRVDVGSRILVVERISLLYTTFRSLADLRTTQVANIVLHAQWIDNITRSKAMRERITLVADFFTSFGDIQLLKNELQDFVRDKENCRDFQPEVDIEVLGLGEMSKLELCIEIRHKSNWANESVRATRRSKFMCALVTAVRKVPIYGPGGGDAALGAPENPSYSVTISDQEAQTKRDKYEADKEKDRMVPISEMDSTPAADSKATGSEMHDKPNNDVKYRSHPVSTSPTTGKSPGAPTSVATFIESLHSRPVETQQSGGRDGSSTTPDASRPSLREPSTGRRGPDPNSAFVSPNTPAESSATPPSFPNKQQSQPSQPPTRMTTEYYEDTTPEFAPSAGGHQYLQSYTTPPPPAQATAPSVRTGPEASRPPPPRQQPMGNAFALQREQQPRSGHPHMPPQ